LLLQAETLAKLFKNAANPVCGKRQLEKLFGEYSHL
jgi:hypothetical protein